MKRFWPTSLVLAVVVLPLSAHAACREQGGLVCGGAPSITSPGGLQVSRGGNFNPLNASRPLRSGDRILSGENAATLSLGQACSTVVSPGSLVTLSRSGGQTCARVTSVEATAPGLQADTAVLSNPSLTGLGLAAGAAGAAGIAVAVSSSGSGRNRLVPVSAQ